MQRSAIVSLSVAGLCTIAIIIVLVANRGADNRVTALRLRGVYPEEGKAKEDDVLRLLQAGEKIMAIRCYREIHNVGLKEAKDAVEALEKANA
jgi:ribosomal protein L7/L12